LSGPEKVKKGTALKAAQEQEFSQLPDYIPIAKFMMELFVFQRQTANHALKFVPRSQHPVPLLPCPRLPSQKMSSSAVLLRTR